MSEAVAGADGTILVRHHARPVRVERDGKWLPVDTTLIFGTHSITPTATAASVSFSAGGPGPMATITTGEKTFSIDSPVGVLRSPTLDGDTATYADVLPDVDLKLRADVDGFAQVLVVKTRQAATSQKLARLTFGLAGKGLTARADAHGNLRVTDAKGKLALTGNTPIMWDTPAGHPATDAAATHGRSRAMATTVTRNRLSVIANAAMLADPATVFPVYIDPGVTLNRSTWAQVDSGTPTTAYWNSANAAQIGTTNAGTNKRRAFFNFDLSTGGVAGTYVTGANLNLDLTSSGSCTAKQIDLYATGTVTSTTTWNAQPAWGTLQSSQTVSKGYDASCPAGTIAMDATNAVRTAVSGSSSSVTLGLRSPDELDNTYAKTVGNNPTLAVTYTGYPTTADVSTSPSTPCVTGTSRPYINTATPLLQARVNDPEGASVRPEFEWSAAGGARIGGVQPTPGQASGSLFATTVAAGQFVNGSSYSWRVRGFDGTVWGSWSSSCEFTVDTTIPSAAPTVSSTTYPAGAWSGSAGTTGTFTFGASGTGDIATYVYGLDNSSPTDTVNAASMGGSATVSITPATDGVHTLTVRARDRAGNLSPATNYTFQVGTAAVTSPDASTVSAGKVVLQAQAASNTGVTFQWRRSSSSTWTTIPAADVTTTAGGAAVTWPVAASGTSGAVTTYPQLTWNVAQTVNNAEAGASPLNGPVVVRAVVNGTNSALVKFLLNLNRATAASQNVGPGEVNLITGNFTFTDPDISVDSYGSDLTVSRTYNSRLFNKTDAANMFGPGWTSSVTAKTAGAPYTSLDRTDTLVQVGLPNGDTVGFTARTSTAFDSETGAESLSLTYNSVGDLYTLVDVSGTTTVFTKLAGAPAGTYEPSTITTPGSGQDTTITWQKATVDGVDVFRPTRLLAPIPAGVSSCTTLVRGCRALTFTYAATTTATGTTNGTFGDYTGRVRKISFTAWDPDLATPAMRTIDMARYAYDTNGRLRRTWDDRLDYTVNSTVEHVRDTYAYDSDGVLNNIAPAGGQEPWQLNYTTIPGDASKGRLASTTRSALAAGTATTTVVYNIPVTGDGAPRDLSATQTARWGQTEPPTDATAVYPATQVPDGNQATGVLPTSTERATIHYMDANGREVNTTMPGGRLSATAYDRYGNQIRTLDAANLLRALTQSTTDSAAQESAIAAKLSTMLTYSSDGQQLLDTLGPERDMVLPDSSTVRGRTHIHNTFDEGAPTGGPYNLVTTSTVTARYTVNGLDVDSDARTTKTDYDWALRSSTAVTVDPGGLNQIARTTYDSATGLTTSTTAPAGGTSTNTPSTRATVFYRAGTGSGNTECDNKPDWANLPCRIQRGGQPTSGAELPFAVLTYDILNQPRVATEKNSTSTLRTTTITYDVAGRPYESTTTGPGTSIPTRRNIYDQATGLLLRTQSVVSGTVTAEIVRGYDTLGRLTSYADADGVTSTMTYDLLSRPATTYDGKATSTYTYDGGTERRGLLTQVVDSQAGTFTASYDDAGRVTSQTWPSGVAVNQQYNETGDAIGIDYLTSSSCTTAACTLYTDDSGSDTHSLTRWDSNSLDRFNYDYDNAGRLTDVEHTTATACVLRQYSYDTASNRKGLATYGPSTGACSDTNLPGSRAWTYDSADRVTNTGYTYDTLGRILTVPSLDTANNGGAVTVAYHASDLVDTITQNGRTTDYTLDVIGERVRSWTDTSTGTAIHRNHYDGDADSPSWTEETTTSYTRPITAMGGMAGIYNSATNTVDYQITNLHGDVAATIHGAGTGLTTTQLNDEFGKPTDTSNVGTIRYDWLGAYQRAADAPAGITLMGVRLYNATTGRFLSVDPVDGGSANDYDYANQDPVNSQDLSGRCDGCDAVVATYHWGPSTSILQAMANTYAGVINSRGNATKIWQMVGRMPGRCPPSPRKGNCGYRGTSWGYEISFGQRSVYKYGITSVPPPTSRANQSRALCANAGFLNCDVKRILQFPDRYSARLWEWTMCTSYVLRYGKRPPGMRSTCR